MAQGKKGTGKSSGRKRKNKEYEEKRKAEIREMQEKRKADKRVIDEIWAIVFIALGIFIFAAVQFKAAGEVGNYIGEFLKGVFGVMGLIFPWYLIIFGILLIAKKTAHISGKTIFLVFLMFLMICILNSGRFIDANTLKIDMGQFYDDGVVLDNGGLFGMIFGTFIVKTLGQVGLYVLTIVVILICLLLSINTPFSRGVDKVMNRVEEKKIMREEKKSGEIDVIDDIPIKSATKYEPQFDIERPTGNRNKKSNILSLMGDKHLFGKDTEDASSAPDLAVASDTGRDYSKSYGLEEKPDYGCGYGLDGGASKEVEGKSVNNQEDNVSVVSVTTEKMSNKEAASVTLNPNEISLEKHIGRYKKPPIDLLNKPKLDRRTNVNSELKAKAIKLENTLKNFNVDARVIRVTQGPAVTRYEIQPNTGVKVNSIVRLADDIALNLEAKSIRIEAPIPGKAAVGIEVENDKINMVTLREIVDSNEFKSAKSRITFAVGKDIAGNSIVSDLKGMPHLLIAGSTGSGKSVCINSIITSILYKANPDEVKLVLIDPKVVELGNYNGIPHLLIPVVTEPTKAAASLNWAVAEMTDRYKKFAEAQVRDLESYNEHMKANNESESVMPQVVIIIDELADLMMAAPSQVEESICRLAQMARAAGMHLIVATQRPSVDIITGVIKANIPSRIAFAVSSQFDSRTILDMAGAEKLVGKGDMLFNPLGMGKPLRVQGTFVSDEEVNSVIEFVKAQTDEVEYAGDVMDTIEKGNISKADGDDVDELLAEAIEFVVTSGHASASMLQRRFRVGYNRAARMIEDMEARGIIGPQDGSRQRQVLLTEEELQQMKDEDNNQ